MHRGQGPGFDRFMTSIPIPTLRACSRDDALALAQIGQATFLDAYADVLPGADILAHCQTQNSPALYAEWLARPGYRFWLAETATGAPVGFAMTCPPDLPVAIEPGDVELKRIYLLHRFQGTGTGAALMARALEAAKADGFQRLLLGVYAENTGALGFYASQGFTQVGVRTFRVGANDYDDLVLGRGV